MLRRGIRFASRGASMFGGPKGQLFGAALGAVANRGGGGGGGARSMSILPGAGAALPRLGQAMGRAGRVATSPGGQIAIGVGTAVAAGRIARGGGGGAPVRRRAKGITGRELKAFTRVNGILDKFCKIKPPTRRAGSPRRGKACR